ncbi:MAG: AraC family transcriptional regulator [Clostridia bacterium]|nr:AraC family transcriptional regulator [Clostridia bacterium]
MSIIVSCERSDTNEPLEIIAETLGFSSATHFMTSFKQMMNMTPTQYRKEKSKKV